MWAFVARPSPFFFKSLLSLVCFPASVFLLCGVLECVSFRRVPGPFAATDISPPASICCPLRVEIARSFRLLVEGWRETQCDANDRLDPWRVGWRTWLLALRVAAYSIPPCPAGGRSDATACKGSTARPGMPYDIARATTWVFRTAAAIAVGLHKVTVAAPLAKKVVRATPVKPLAAPVAKPVAAPVAKAAPMATAVTTAASVGAPLQSGTASVAAVAPPRLLSLPRPPSGKAGACPESVHCGRWRSR